MANNKKELTELLNAIGMTAEMALNFFEQSWRLAAPLRRRWC